MPLCEYGCGQEAKYQFKNGKWCCSISNNSCPNMRKINRDLNKGRIVPKGRKMEKFISIESSEILCSYGCGNIAKYKTKKTKRYCCEDHISKCPVLKEKNRRKNKNGNKDKQKFETFKNVDKKLCEYGCSNIAKYKNIKDKVCCSEYPSQCLKQRVINKEKNLGKKHTEEELCEMREIQKKNRITIEQIKGRYPFFYKVEELRYNPNKEIEEREIQVHCKYYDCKNSKEKSGWFSPSKSSFISRIQSLEKHGKDNSYFYCSQECKDLCPIFWSQGSDPYKETDLPYTQEEYQTFREHVLKRDNYKCQYCNKKAEHVHHERPQKLEPFFALDPDLAWSCCQKCHYEKGHKDECSTGKLASKTCSHKEKKINE